MPIKYLDEDKKGKSSKFKYLDEQTPLPPSAPPPPENDWLGRSYRDALEMSGALVGGLGAGVGGTLIEPGGGTILGGLVGAGVGRATGTTIADTIDWARGRYHKTPLEGLKGVGESAIQGVGGQMLGDVVGVPIGAGAKMLGDEIGQVGGLIPRGVAMAKSMIPRVLQATADMPQAAGEMLVKGGPYPEGSPSTIQAGVKKVTDILASLRGKAAEPAAAAEAEIPGAVQDVVGSVKGTAKASEAERQRVIDSANKSIPSRVQGILSSFKSAKDQAKEAITAAKERLGVYKTLENRVDNLPFSGKTPLETITRSFKSLMNSTNNLAEGDINALFRQGKINFDEFTRLHLEHDAMAGAKGLSTADRVRELVQLRQQINKYTEGTYNASGGLEDLSKEQIGTLKEMAAGINNELDKIPEATPLRAAEGKFSKMARLYDQVQPSMDTPGRAEQFLYKAFKAETPVDRESLQALFAMEKMTGKPVVRDLFKKFYLRDIESARASTVFEEMQKSIDTPAKAQEFLYRMFKGKSAKDTDAMNTLVALDRQTGKTTARDLFQKFGNADTLKEQAESAYKNLVSAMETPGKAEEFLYNTYKGTKPTDKENLMDLLALERMSGKPVINDLFKEFSGREIQKGLAGKTIRSTLGGLSFFVLRAFGIPPAVSLPVALAAQSPKISSMLIPGGLKALEAVGSASRVALPVAVNMLRKRREK